MEATQIETSALLQKSGSTKQISLETGLSFPDIITKAIKWGAPTLFGLSCLLPIYAVLDIKSNGTLVPPVPTPENSTFTGDEILIWTGIAGLITSGLVGMTGVIIHRYNHPPILEEEQDSVEQNA